MFPIGQSVKSSQTNSLDSPAINLSGHDFVYLRARSDFGECGRIRAGHPDLRAKTRERVVKRVAPVRVEMRDDFIQQKHWRKAGHLTDQPGMREHEPDQQRFLLAG